MAGDKPPGPGQAGPLTREALVARLRELGVANGQTLLVHVSMRSLGWVDGGPGTVVGALRDAVGRDGNIVVSAVTEENSKTSRAHLARIAGLRPAEVAEYRRRMLPFNPRYTRATGAGLVAEQVRTAPGAVRSDHPQSSFAAIGPLARELMAGHALECHHGELSPLAKLYDGNASALMLGVGYRSCTALHLAEYRYTERPPLWSYSCVVSSGDRSGWTEYQDVALDDRSFEAIGEHLDEQGAATRSGQGPSEWRLVPVRRAVDAAAQWLAAHR